MRLFALLLLAAVVGFAVGRLTAPDAGGRGGERQAVPAALPRQAIDAESPSTVPQPAVPLADAAPPAPDRHAEAPPPPGAGPGYLELDSVGAPAWKELGLAAPSLRGEWRSVGFTLAGGGVTRLELAPGPYRLTAKAGGDLGPRTWRFVIESGGTVVVQLGAPPAQSLFPIPDGLGRLDMTVFRMDGRPLEGVSVLIMGRGPTGAASESETTNNEGRARIHLLPGSYVVAVGGQHRKVHLLEGETVEVVFRYAGEGEVMVEDSVDLLVDLIPLRAGEAPDSVSRRPVATWPPGSPGDGGDRTLYYVRPGRYRVELYGDDRETPLDGGEVEVRPGEVVRFGPPLPRGSLEVCVRLRVDESADDDPPIDDHPIEVTPLSAGEPFRVRFWRSASSCWVCHLKAGRYRVRFEAEGWEPAEAEVVVGEEAEDPATVSLETRPSG